MKIKYIFLMILMFFITGVVYANDIKDISMDIYIDNNGDAHIKETWVANLNSGTEGYKPYYNLGTSEIKDFKVKFNNREFETLSYWNVNNSFSEKKYKAGLHRISDGYELCFGISEYGLNTYEMDYTITNFVVELNDADMVYWTLIPYELSDKPDKVYIKIHSDFEYEDTLDVWGYGNYGGTAYVYDGYIEMNHEDELDSDEYMTVLIKFPKESFNNQTKIDQDFNYYYEMAEEGTTHYVDSDSKPKSFISTFFEIIFSIIDAIIEIIIIIVPISLIFYSANKNAYGTLNLKFNKGITKVKDAPYFRDIPCKNIFEGYWVACQFKLVKNKNDFLGAILLKWIRDKNIEKTNIENNKTDALRFITDNNLTEVEKELYNMMKEASIDGVLEDKEFTKWCKNHYSKILRWFNKIIDEQTQNFVSEGIITKEGRKYLVNDSIREYGLKVSGLKNFLNDFSNIKDRNAIEVIHWQEYLMYAQIFGIAEKVAKEFKDLYPDVITDDTYNDVIFIHNISYNGVSAATRAKSQAEQRASSYSSGGGGFSSGGGGGGSFGGGGGGGGFR